MLDISRSSYYTWKTRSKSMRDKVNEALVFEIKLIYEKGCRIYGSFRITSESIRCDESIARFTQNNGIVAKMKLLLKQR